MNLLKLELLALKRQYQASNLYQTKTIIADFVGCLFIALIYDFTTTVFNGNLITSYFLLCLILINIGLIFINIKHINIVIHDEISAFQIYPNFLRLYLAKIGKMIFQLYGEFLLINYVTLFLILLITGNWIFIPFIIYFTLINILALIISILSILNHNDGIVLKNISFLFFILNFGLFHYQYLNFYLSAFNIVIILLIVILIIYNSYKRSNYAKIHKSH